MRVITANGLFVLVPAALYPNGKASLGRFDAAFCSVQLIELTVECQCDLLGLCRSSWYYQPPGAGSLLRGAHAPDRCGVHKNPGLWIPLEMTAWLRTQGHVRSIPSGFFALMRIMGVEAITSASPGWAGEEQGFFR